MSDDIDELVDWQLSNQTQFDKTGRHQCPTCGCGRNAPTTVCPECP